MDHESELDATYSSEDDTASTSSDEFCVDDVDDVTSASEMGSTDHIEKPVDLMGNSAHQISLPIITIWATRRVQIVMQITLNKQIWTRRCSHAARPHNGTYAESCEFMRFRVCDDASK